VEHENELEEKRQMKNKNDSLLQQLREEENAELEQKHKQAMAKELINEASIKMAAAIEQNKMQCVQVAHMMLKAGMLKDNNNISSLACCFSLSFLFSFFCHCLLINLTVIF